MIKVYHIIAHTIDPYANIKNGTITEFSHLDHAVNKFLKLIVRNDNYGEREHILVCLSSKIRQNKLSLFHVDGYKVIVLKSHSFFYPFEISFMLIPFFVSIISKNDIIHIHGISSFILESIFPFFFKKKVLLHYRGGHFTWKSFPISFIKYGIFLFFSLLSAKYIFVENKKRLQIYHKKYFVPLHKLIYIHGILGYQIPPINYYIDRVNDKGQGFNILFVGRLEKAKGIYDLVDVFDLFQSRYPLTTLHIVGDGSLKNQIEEITCKSTNIKYHGFLSSENLKTIYKQSDIFILPTYYDSFGLVLLEAMTFGIPVISTFTEGPSDIIQDNFTGFLFKPGDKNQLFYYLELLYLNDDLRNQVSTNAYKSILTNFNDKNNIKDVISVYQKLSL